MDVAAVRSEHYTVMKQLIINADDFGLTDAVNTGIVEAHLHGIVTSTTIMATGEAFDAAVSMRHRTPRLGVGAHLNLTGGRPVSPAQNISSLVDNKGQLHLSPGRLLRALVTRQVRLAEIEIELRSQVTKILEAGIRPTHLDGHKHVHLLPGVAEIVIRLAKEFAISSVRCPREVAPPLQTRLGCGSSRLAILKQRLVARAVSTFARPFARRLAEAGLQHPAHFYGLSQTGFLNARELVEILTVLPQGVSELMCHPGYVDRALVYSGTRLLAQREIELRALTEPSVKRLAAARGILLLSYQQLDKRTGPSPALAEHSNMKGLSDES